MKKIMASGLDTGIAIKMPFGMPKFHVGVHEFATQPCCGSSSVLNSNAERQQ